MVNRNGHLRRPTIRRCTEEDPFSRLQPYSISANGNGCLLLVCGWVTSETRRQVQQVSQGAPFIPPATHVQVTRPSSTDQLLRANDIMVELRNTEKLPSP